MERKTLILQKIWSEKIAEWDQYYGPLTEALATHCGHSNATQILLNAQGRRINTLVKGMQMFYKFEDESEDMFRISVEQIPLGELENILR